MIFQESFNFNTAIIFFRFMDQQIYNNWRTSKKSIDDFVIYCKTYLPSYFQFFKHLEEGFEKTHPNYTYHGN
jgi:hypothetical protein